MDATNVITAPAWVALLIPAAFLLGILATLAAFRHAVRTTAAQPRSAPPAVPRRIPVPEHPLEHTVRNHRGHPRAPLADQRDPHRTMLIPQYQPGPHDEPPAGV